MFGINSVSDFFVKALLLAVVALVFLTTTVALGNVVFGVLSSAAYVYAISRV